MPQIFPDNLRDALTVLTERYHTGEEVVDAARKNRTEDDPQIDARSPQCARECAEDGAQSCDVEQLNKEYLPRWERNVIHAVLQSNGRCGLARAPKNSVYECAVDKIADNERRERAKKCNHCLSLLSFKNTRRYANGLSGKFSSCLLSPVTFEEAR